MSTENTSAPEKSNDSVVRDVAAQRKGISWLMGSYFVVTVVAGTGFLSLPKALANTGWIGIAIAIMSCALMGSAGLVLGECWLMLEERWPEEYLGQNRQPYMEIAEKSLGPKGRATATVLFLTAQIGGTAVGIILLAQFLNSLLPQLSICEYTLITGAAVLPFSWLSTPKKFWPSSVLATLSTIIVCLIVVIEILRTEIDEEQYIQYPPATFVSFWQGFGAILFSFGGAAVFPTIQNDLKNRNEFWKSIVLGSSCLLTLYLGVAISGYAVYGNTVASNILITIESSGAVKAAMILEIVNLLGTFLIAFNPVCQIFEHLLKAPMKFGWQRVVIRSTILALEVFISLAIPDFGKIVSFIGGMFIPITGIILPPIMFMILADAKDTEHQRPARFVPLWMRVALCEVIIIGVIGGVSSTVSSVISLATDPNSFESSCITNFNMGQETAA